MNDDPDQERLKLLVTEALREADTLGLSLVACYLAQAMDAIDASRYRARLPSE